MRRAVLLGHSMGGLVCLAAAAAWPERVAGVCIVTSGARLPVSPLLFELLKTDYVRFGEWIEDHCWSRKTPRDVVERWRAVALTARQEVTLADYRAVERFDAGPLLSSLRAPALVLAGEDDRMTPPTLSAELASRLASARLVVVPEAGHMLMQEQPARFFEELSDFLVTM
jgi:pimeloyl-ACP methyl ester carboxylesterase